jgi:hypothetical protein
MANQAGMLPPGGGKGAEQDIQVEGDKGASRPTSMS